MYPKLFDVTLNTILKVVFSGQEYLSSLHEIMVKYIYNINFSIGFGYCRGALCLSPASATDEE